MKPLNFRETLSFAVIDPSDRPGHPPTTTSTRTKSLFEQKFDLRVKAALTFGRALVPDRFSDAIFLGEGSLRRKNYRSVVCYKKGARPLVFSETCYLTTKRHDLTYRTEVERDSSAKQKTANRWFTNAVVFEVKKPLTDAKDEILDVINRSGKVILVGSEKFRASSSVVEDCDFNQNVTRSTSSLSDSLLRGYQRYCTPSNCRMIHVKCRNSVYPRSTIERQHVPDDKIDWSVPFPEYSPPNHTDKLVYGKEWADVDYEKEGDPKTASWNEIDPQLKVDRTSFLGKYDFFENGLPRNPMGRTGLRGRGVLGKWGPNHAGDPIVTRWKRDAENKKVIHKSSGKPVLQFVSIQRRDNKEWAIPGGMVDPGEMISETLKREFAEEALNLLEKSEKERDKSLDRLNKAFRNGEEIYKGYVDDPRNTDNSWMETIAYNFHDEEGTIFNMKFHSGDDAIGVTWMDIDGKMELYASHKSFVEKVVKLRSAHW